MASIEFKSGPTYVKQSMSGIKLEGTDLCGKHSFHRYNGIITGPIMKFKQIAKKKLTSGDEK